MLQATTAARNRLPPFPPRRPLRHQQPHTPLTQSQSIQQQLPELQTSASQHLPCDRAARLASQTIAPPRSSSRMPLIAGAGTLFETSWRATVERVHGELARLHTLYATALRKERQEKEVFRAHCMRLKGERDIAREKLRRALGRRYDDGSQLPVADGESTGEKRWKSSHSTPPLSAHAASSFSGPPAKSIMTHTPSDLLDSLIAVTEPSLTDLIHAHTYPSPSSSSPSPPPPQQMPLPSGQQQDSECSNDHDNLGSKRGRKRDSVEENEECKPSKRRRTLSNCSASPSLKTDGDTHETKAMDTLRDQEPDCNTVGKELMVQTAEEGSDPLVAISEGSLLSSPTQDADRPTCHRRSLHVDLMSLLEGKLLCRCA
jgi:hypothetical protein